MPIAGAVLLVMGSPPFFSEAEEEWVKTPAPCRYSLLRVEHAGAGRIPHMGQLTRFFIESSGYTSRPGPTGLLCKGA